MIQLDELTREIRTVLSYWSVPGCAVGIRHKSQTIVDFHHGRRSLHGSELIDENSVFCIASISKVFVATAILHLHETELLDIHSPVISYVPYFEMNDSRYRDITIEMLLSHRSGLPDLTMSEYLIVLENPNMSYRDYIRLFSHKDLNQPGEQFHYSNFGYALLAEVITSVTNVPFIDFMDEHVFQPLGMVHSSFAHPNDLGNVAYPHLRIPGLMRSERYPYSLVDAPASFMHTTLEDLLSFYENRHRLLSEDMFQTMVEPLSKRSYPPFYMASGRGINIGEFHSHKVYSHGGMGFGFTGFYMIFPDLEMSAVVLCNEESYAHEQLAHLVASAITDAPLISPKPSWLNQVATAYESEGPEEAFRVAKSLMRQNDISTDPEDLKNILYQILVAGRKDRFEEYGNWYLTLFPEDSEVLFLMQEFK